ncbi:hypothetical protein ACFLXP_01460 [Chloroflexota bacterium]
MKGLIQTSLVFLTLIGFTAITSVIMTNNHNDQLDTAREKGTEEGSIKGYASGLYAGMVDGHQASSKIGYAISQSKSIEELGDNFYFTYNPTYEEVQGILAGSDAEKAMEINNYAEAHGIRTAYIRCQIARRTEEKTVYVYNVIAFDTTDRGFIIIRPRTHEEIKVEIGKSYSELNGFPHPSYDDTITKMTIYW